MSDPGDSESTAPWIADRPPRSDTPDGAPRIEAIPDADAGTVTFAARDDGADATAAWITVDASLVVDVGDYT
ncbi:hypothetical protein [Halosimplex marinum]|uniref:hypothetical protein n=1 Tax=Halosimplex marinum TaxID=3396620 RepID=UPI003F5571FF